MRKKKGIGRRLLSLLLAVMLVAAVWDVPKVEAWEQSDVKVPSSMVLRIGETKTIDVSLSGEATGLTIDCSFWGVSGEERAITLGENGEVKGVKCGKERVRVGVYGNIDGELSYGEYYVDIKVIGEKPANPVYDEETKTTTWDYVYFGSYPQSEVMGSELTTEIKQATYIFDSSSGKDAEVDGIKYHAQKNMTLDEKTHYYKWEPLKWRVLECDGETMLLMADKAVLVSGYDSVFYWLNNFYDDAFNNEEKKGILESIVETGSKKIYFLSKDDMNKQSYGFVEREQRIIKLSDYAFAKGAKAVSVKRQIYKEGHERPWEYNYPSKLSDGWWLRSVGEEYMDTVDGEGDYSTMYKTGSWEKYKYDIGLREGGQGAIVPALRVSLASDSWTVAEEESGEPLQLSLPTTTLNNDGSATFQTKATGGDASAYTYQWYLERGEMKEADDCVSVELNGRATPIEGATSAEYTAENCAGEGNVYFCEVSDGKTIAHSDRIGLAGPPLFDGPLEQGLKEEEIENNKTRVHVDVSYMDDVYEGPYTRIMWYHAETADEEGEIWSNGGKLNGCKSTLFSSPELTWLNEKTTGYYYVTLSNGLYTVTSPRIRLDVFSKPKVTDPADQYVKLGSNASFSVETSEAYPASCTYQWYCAPNSLEAAEPIRGATSAVYNIPAREVTSSLNGYFFYCVVDNGQYQVTTNKAKLTVYGSITVNKKNLLAAIRQAENLQEKGWTKESWARLQDALVSAQTVYDDRDIPQQQIVDEACENLSNAIKGLEKDNTIWVTDITLRPAVLSLSVEDEVKIEASLEPENATHQDITWSSSNEETVVLIPQQEAGCVTVKALKEGTAVITAKADDITKTCAVTVSGKGSIPKLQVSTPAEQSVKMGANVTFRVEASGGHTSDYEYQWYVAETEKGAGTKIAGAVSPEYALPGADVSKAQNGRYYYCTVRAGEETVQSGRARLTVYYPPQVSAPKNQSVRTGSKASFSVSVSESSPTACTYQWYQAPSEKGAGTKIAGAVSSTYTIPASNMTIDKNGSCYYCVVSNGQYEVQSGRAKLSVNFQAPKPAVKIASANAVKITWNKMPGAEGYYVYRATSRKGKFTKAGTAKGTSFTDKKLKSGKTYYYKVAAYKGKLTGPQSEVSSKKILGKLATPKLKLSQNKAKGTVTLAWSPIKNADKIEIWRKVTKNGSKSGAYKKWKTISGKKKNMTYSYRGLTPGHDYFYQIRAYYKKDKVTVYSYFSKGLGIRL